VLVLGSRGLAGITGFVMGSVGLSVIAHATCPIVAVREKTVDSPRAEGAVDGSDPSAPVVVGVDLQHSYGSVLAFAFETAALRRAGVRVVHTWSVQNLYAYPSALPDPQVVVQAGTLAERELSEAVRPWQRRFPQVPVEKESGAGGAAPCLLEMSADAGLLVVGRRLRGHPFPTRIGPVTHAALHHAPCPVAVVPHE
jgi:nucleotide-binding universal stress UspA family protein